MEGLKISFTTHAGQVQAVRGVTFSLAAGEAVALVGESGCGKSATAHAIMGLIPDPPGKITGGAVFFDGEDLLLKSEGEMEKIRGNRIGMVFQDPMTCLNPTMTIGGQLMEGLMEHRRLSRSQAKEKAMEMLSLVGISRPERRIKQYPYEFSGGMRQRVMIAMALSCQPDLIIADEPTSALDVTIQAQILELLKGLQKQIGSSIILITHDLGVVASLCSRVLVMYAGQIVEAGHVREVFYQPRHPYTWSLLQAVPRLDVPKKERLASLPGQPPDLIQPSPACSFAPRCAYAMRICLEEAPPETVAGSRRVSCWLMDPRAPQVPWEGVS